MMDPRVALLGFVEFAVFFGAALFLSRKRILEKDLPRIALLSAGIFVAQMVNFPIGGGTTGHLVGGALFAVLAGPVIAIIGMTVVLALQALMFGDGGITAFGLNAVNMAVIAPLVGWGVYTLVRPFIRDADAIAGSVAVAAGAWASVFVAAAACAAELAVSYAISGGDYGIAGTVAVPAMLGYHAVIGIGEAAISSGVVAYLAAEHRNAFRASAPPSSQARRSARPMLASLLRSPTAKASGAILLVFALVLPLYFVYSAEGEDGLERTMSDAGVGEGEPVFSAPFSYGENYLAGLLAGLIGFLAVMLVSLGALSALRRVRSAEEA